jgi:phosphoribosylaminoimidazolecarboxamide formyltransferase/IMP cyclohydrolase
MVKIKRALVSVSDKTGITEFAKELINLNVEVLSTGGTAKTLKGQGLPIMDVSEYTGFPEMLDGRVKTLHPKIHGGLLGIRDNPDHVKKMKEYHIEPIDLVVVNLYPFEATIAKKDSSLEEAIENIDIGGPTMLRSAAKNYRFVTVIVDPADYPAVLKEMKDNRGEIFVETNFRLAKKVFQHTARYDGAISNYLGSLTPEGGRIKFPETLNLQFFKVQGLRYGENPHQEAAFYREGEVNEPSAVNAMQLQGKELSFNNILDIDAAIDTAKEFDEMAAVIIKHNNPCGVAVSKKSINDAYEKAKAVDPASAFGGIVVVNRAVDGETARTITSLFTEVVIAPDFTPDALEIFKTKKDLRLLKLPMGKVFSLSGFDLKKVAGGILVQDRDLMTVDISKAKVVTKRAPTAQELKGLDFAWKVCKHVKSNAIVYSKEDQLIGVGAGQMSRVDSSRIAAFKAQFPLKGAVMASDAMFPFRDNVDAAAEVGITAIVQPGGSVRDDEVIRASDEFGMAMLFTGVRHFKH